MRVEALKVEGSSGSRVKGGHHWLEPCCFLRWNKTASTYVRSSSATLQLLRPIATWKSGSRIWGLGFRVWGSWFRVKVLGLGIGGC
jgi:hypothetical protein